MEKETFVEMEIGERVYKIGNLGTILGANDNPLKQRLNRDGYLEVTLGNGEKNKRSTYRVHRLVAQCFVPNPNKEEDENKVWDSVIPIVNTGVTTNLEDGTKMQCIVDEEGNANYYKLHWKKL